MKKILTALSIGISLLASPQISHAEESMALDVGGSCLIVGAAMVGAGAVAARVTRGRGMNGGERIIHAGVGCSGGAVLGAAAAASAAEAPSQEELQNDRQYQSDQE